MAGRLADNKHRLCIDLLAEVVDGRCLRKAGLGVPELVFPAGVALVIGFSVADSSCLLPQGVGDGGIQLHPARFMRKS